MSRFLGIVCGLKSEARVAYRSAPPERLRIAVSGADSARAEALTAGLCREGAKAIVSVGISGALSPHLKPGDLLIAERVVTDQDAISCDPVLWTALLGVLQKTPGAAVRPAVTLFGADAIIASPAEKARLYREFGAAAVDMESHGAGRAAREAGVPFAAIRAVADPASRAVPRAALNAVAPDGGTRVIPTLINCVKAPGDVPALLKLGAESSRALRSLSGRLDQLLGALFRLDL